MSEFLDELARTLAKPMPRRRALKLLGGAMVSVAAPAIVARPARAAPQRTEAGCPPGVCGVPFIQGCQSAGKCPSTHPICCKFPGKLGAIDPNSEGLCSQNGNPAVSPPGGTACCCPPGHSCGAIPGAPCVCSGPKCTADGKCCKRPNRCVKGKCCPAIRTTRAAGGGRAVACCPPGTIAVPGRTALCCPKGDKNCCDNFDPRSSDDETPPLPPPKGKLCVRGKLRKS